MAVWSKAGGAALFGVSLLFFLVIALTVAGEVLGPFDDDFCLGATKRPLQETTHVEQRYSVVPLGVTCRYEYPNGTVEILSAPRYGRTAAIGALSVIPLAGMVLSLARRRA